MGEMPRPRSFVSEALEDAIALPPYQPMIDFDANWWMRFRRAFAWVNGIGSFILGTLVDMILPWREDNDDRRAERLYRIIKRLGGTFVKIGQQISIRIDLLPYAYYTRLSKLLDEVDPFPTEEAIKAIERAAKKPLHEIFSRFDPTPIGSGSIACVYQGILRETGETVAVKVRRPGIGYVFAADFDILRFLFVVLKFFNALPEIMNFEALDEIHDVIMEELDFRQEARHQDLFRQLARDAYRKYFTAPKVYFEYSGEDVIMQEFIRGVLLKHLLTMVEQNDVKGLERLKKYNIHPKEVSHRLIWVNYWTIWNGLFFHSDPHPANVIVTQDNLLNFIDFGSVSSLGYKRRWALQQVFEFEQINDLEGAARVAITLMEPLPPLPTHLLEQDVKAEFQRAVVALRSNGTPWTEKTSAQLWFGFFRVARKYDVPVNPVVVRLVRGTMLYDTLSARLNPKIDILGEYELYRKDAGLAARRRVNSALQRRVKGGPTTDDYLRLEQLVGESERAVFQLQRFLSNVEYSVLPLVGKFVAIANSIVRLITRLVAIWLGPPLIFFVLLLLGTIFRTDAERVSFVELVPLLWEQVVSSVLLQDGYWLFTITMSLIILFITGSRVTSNLYDLDDE